MAKPIAVDVPGCLSIEQSAALADHLLGSIERFFGILIEHYAGKFPLWLAPVQVKILTVGDRHDDFAREVSAALRARDIRTELDLRNENK